MSSRYHKLAAGQADQVRPDHGDVNIARHLQPAHLSPEMPAAVNDFAGHGAIGKNAAFVINVAQKQIERGNALGQAALDEAPFRAGNQAGQEIVRKDLLGAFFPSINREGDALVQKGQVGGVFAAADLVGGQGGKGL